MAQREAAQPYAVGVQRKEADQERTREQADDPADPGEGRAGPRAGRAGRMLHA